MDQGAWTSLGTQSCCMGVCAIPCCLSRASFILCVSLPAVDPGASHLNLLQFGFSRHNDRAAKSPRADGDWGGCWRARWQLQGILGCTGIYWGVLWTAGHGWMLVGCGVHAPGWNQCQHCRWCWGQNGLQLSHSSTRWWPHSGVEPRGDAGWEAAGDGDLVLPGRRDTVPCQGLVCSYPGI